MPSEHDKEPTLRIGGGLRPTKASPGPSNCPDTASPAPVSSMAPSNSGMDIDWLTKPPLIPRSSLSHVSTLSTRLKALKQACFTHTKHRVPETKENQKWTEDADFQC